MSAHQKKAWSQKHGGIISLAIFAGLVSLACPLLLVLLIPLGIICTGATLAGYFHTKATMEVVGQVGAEPERCAWCGTIQSNSFGWFIAYGALHCPDSYCHQR